MRKFHGQRNVLGASVLLCTLPWLVFVPDEVGTAPAAVMAHQGRQGEVAMGLSFGDVRRALKREHFSDINCRQPH